MVVAEASSAQGLSSQAGTRRRHGL